MHPYVSHFPAMKWYKEESKDAITTTHIGESLKGQREADAE